MDQENPARLIRSSPASPKEPKVLVNSEIRRLRQVLAGVKGPLAERDRLIFELLLGTGIRLGSLVALNAGHIDLRIGTLNIQLKGGAEGRMFLNPTLRRAMSRFLKQNATQASCGPNTPLFRGQSGNRLGVRQIQLRFARWFQEAGFDRPVSLHAFRHTFATRLHGKTGDLHFVQRALGHRQITTTGVYAQVSDGRLKQAIRAV